MAQCLNGSGIPGFETAGQSVCRLRSDLASYTSYLTPVKWQSTRFLPNNNLLIISARFVCFTRYRMLGPQTAVMKLLLFNIPYAYLTSTSTNIVVRPAYVRYGTVLVGSTCRWRGGRALYGTV